METAHVPEAGLWAPVNTSLIPTNSWPSMWGWSLPCKVQCCNRGLFCPCLRLALATEKHQPIVMNRGLTYLQKTECGRDCVTAVTGQGVLPWPRGSSPSNVAHCKLSELWTTLTGLFDFTREAKNLDFHQKSPNVLDRPNQVCLQAGFGQWGPAQKHEGSVPETLARDMAGARGEMAEGAWLLCRFEQAIGLWFIGVTLTTLIVTPPQNSKQNTIGTSLSPTVIPVFLGTIALTPPFSDHVTSHGLSFLVFKMELKTVLCQHYRVC